MNDDANVAAVRGPGFRPRSPREYQNLPPRTEVREKPPRREEGEPLGRPRWRPRLRARPPPLRLTGDRIASTPNRMSASRVATPKAANGLRPAWSSSPSRPPLGRTGAEKARRGRRDSGKPQPAGGGAFRRKVFGTAIDCTSSIACVGHSFLLCTRFFFCFRPGFFGPRKQKKKQKKGTKACRKRDGPGPSSSDNGTIAIEGVSSRAARGGRRQAGSAGSAGKARGGPCASRSARARAPAPPSPGPH